MSKTTVNRQERRVRAEKKADQEAEAIVASAIENVQAEGRKRGEASAAEIEQGHEVKRLRDAGLAWWAIAHEMGLPGSADNVKAGKSGASKARRLYAAAFGALPATPRSLAKTRPDGFAKGARPEGTRRKDTIRRDPAAASMFQEDAPAPEIIEGLVGKKITWLNALTQTEEESRVHKTGIAIRDVAGHRCLDFRVDHYHDHFPKETAQYRVVPGIQRTIRLSAILRVAL